MEIYINSNAKEYIKEKSADNSISILLNRVGGG